MLYDEFLELSGMTKDDLSVYTYEHIVEPMYMAMPDSLTKYDFIKLLNTKALMDEYPNKNKTIRDIERVAAECKELYGHSSLCAQEEELQKLADFFAKQNGADSAQVSIYGDRGYTMTSLTIELINWKDIKHDDIKWVHTYRLDATKKTLKLIREYKYQD